MQYGWPPLVFSREDDMTVNPRVYGNGPLAYITLTLCGRCQLTEALLAGGGTPATLLFYLNKSISTHRGRDRGKDGGRERER